MPQWIIEWRSYEIYIFKIFLFRNLTIKPAVENTSGS